MSQPVKLSDELILDARTTGDMTERSIAGQIEFWARLGKALEELLNGHKVLALKRRGDRKALSELIDSVDSNSGNRRVSMYLDQLPYPHYEVAPGKPGFFIRIDEDGTRTIGKFANRAFIVAEEESEYETPPASSKRKTTGKRRK